MKKCIKYNYQILKTWVVYVLLKKKFSDESAKLMDAHYNFTPRQKRLFGRIKRINKIQGGNK
jgi:hypothetical protein